MLPFRQPRSRSAWPGSPHPTIDKRPLTADLARVDVEDILGPRSGDPLAGLLAEDLDRLSVAELEARMLALEGEIARCRRKIDSAVHQRASADALFRR